MNIPLPRGSALVEVATGVWLKPRFVGMISVRTPTTDAERAHVAAMVEVIVNNQVRSWHFDSVQDASRFARAVATTCNTEMGVTPATRSCDRPATEIPK